MFFERNEIYFLGTKKLQRVLTAASSRRVTAAGRARRSCRRSDELVAQTIAAVGRCNDSVLASRLVGALAWQHLDLYVGGFTSSHETSMNGCLAECRVCSVDATAPHGAACCADDAKLVAIAHIGRVAGHGAG